MKIFLTASILALFLTACHTNDMGNNNGLIQLSPLGTAANPAEESINESFTLTATESGYTGNFAAQTIVGKCWVVQPPISSPGTWTVAPQGLLCIGGSKADTEQIQVKDSNGNSAITYIRGE